MNALLPVGAGMLLLYLGGEALVKGACSLALKLRVSPMVVGLTIVAFGTSAPELVVSLEAALGGANDIAVGNVIGSNVANLALILGFAAILKPPRVEAKLLRIDAPLMILVSMAVIAMLADDALSRWEGAALLAGFVAYTGFTFLQGRRESAPVQEEFVAVAEGRKRRFALDALNIVGGSVALVFGARLFVEGAVSLAIALGVSQAIIGLTVVALGTSLPEFAATLVAVRRDQGDVAVGNVIGSNLFNLLGILGVTSVVTPLVRGSVGWPTLGVMLGVTILVLPMLYSHRRLSRAEGSVLVSIYVGYLIGLLFVVTSAGRSPAIVIGTFEDDYGIRYTITDSTWVQHPSATYHVERWKANERFVIAQNDSTNSYDPGLWTRIDWLELENMPPYDWAFCLTTFDAVSAEAAEAVTAADPDSPRTGCNGFPYSRMKRTE